MFWKTREHSVSSPSHAKNFRLTEPFQTGTVILQTGWDSKCPSETAWSREGLAWPRWEIEFSGIFRSQIS